MEKEPPFLNTTEPENLESKLRKRGHFIEKADFLESGPTQCDTCMGDGDFEFYDEIWMIDGDPFCGKHKEGVLKKLEQMDADSLKRKEEEKTLTEDERAMRRLLIEAYGKEREFWKEEERIRKIEPDIPLSEIIRKLYQEIEAEQRKNNKQHSNIL